MGVEEIEDLLAASNAESMRLKSLHEIEVEKRKALRQQLNDARRLEQGPSPMIEITAKRRQRALEAYRMRLAGNTYAAIARAFGVSGVTAKYLCDRGLRITLSERNAPASEELVEQINVPSITLDTALHDVTIASTRLRNTSSPYYPITLREADVTSDRELLRTPNLGKKSLRELRSIIAQVKAEAQS